MTGVLTCPYPAGLVLEATSLGSRSCLLRGLPRVSAPTVVSPHRVWQLGRGRWVPVVSTGPACSRHSAHTCRKSGQRYENEHNKSRIFITEPIYWSTHDDTGGDSSPLYAQHSQGNFQKRPSRCQLCARDRERAGHTLVNLSICPRGFWGHSQ